MFFEIIPTTPVERSTIGSATHSFADAQTTGASHKHIAVIGRIPYDDEDSILFFHDMTEEEARKAFADDMYDGNTEAQDVATHPKLPRAAR